MWFRIKAAAAIVTRRWIICRGVREESRLSVGCSVGFAHERLTDGGGEKKEKKPAAKWEMLRRRRRVAFPAEISGKLLIFLGSLSVFFFFFLIPDTTLLLNFAAPLAASEETRRRLRLIQGDLLPPHSLSSGAGRTGIGRAVQGSRSIERFDLSISLCSVCGASPLNWSIVLIEGSSPLEFKVTGLVFC